MIHPLSSSCMSKKVLNGGIPLLATGQMQRVAQSREGQAKTCQRSSLKGISGVSKDTLAYILMSGISGRIHAYLVYPGVSGRICSFVPYLGASAYFCLYQAISVRICSYLEYLGVYASMPRATKLCIYIYIYIYIKYEVLKDI